MEHELRQNPMVTRSMAAITANYLDDFSNPLTANNTSEVRGHLNLSDHDAKRFVTLIGTDDKASNTLSEASGFYQQHTLDQALTTSDDPNTRGNERLTAIEDVGQRSGRLDGLLVAGRVNAEMMHDTDQDADRMAAWREHVMHVNIGKGLGQTALGQIPVAGPYVSAGAGAVADYYIFHDNPMPVPQADYDPGDIKSQGRDDVTVAHNYLNSILNTPNHSHVTAADIAADYPELVDNGRIRGPGELSNVDNQKLIDAASQFGGAGFDHYQQNYDAKQRYDDASYETSQEIPGFTRGND
jgi:hypothetical protein